MHRRRKPSAPCIGQLSAWGNPSAVTVRRCRQHGQVPEKSVRCGCSPGDAGSQQRTFDPRVIIGAGPQTKLHRAGGRLFQGAQPVGAAFVVEQAAEQPDLYWPSSDKARAPAAQPVHVAVLPVPQGFDEHDRRPRSGAIDERELAARLGGRMVPDQRSIGVMPEPAVHVVPGYGAAPAAREALRRVSSLPMSPAGVQEHLSHSVCEASARDLGLRWRDPQLSRCPRSQAPRRITRLSRSCASSSPPTCSLRGSETDPGRSDGPRAAYAGELLKATDAETSVSGSDLRGIRGRWNWGTAARQAASTGGVQYGLKKPIGLRRH